MGMALKLDCKREIRDLRGAIETPNFPQNYPHHADCEWKLIPPMGNRVFLEFSHFELESSAGTESDDCTFDHLTIEERDSNDGLIRTNKYCQILMPKPLNTSHIVVLKFKSDYSETFGGFHLEYEMQGCGGTLTKSEGQFTSPNYPNHYPRDTQCQWVIQVEYGHLIEITLTDFDFSAFTDCKQVGLIVSNNANATKVINRFCGTIQNNQKSVVTSSENTVYVHFYSDFSSPGRGFSATYKSVPAQCGGIFASAQGNITSLNYPNNYPENIHCQWLLRTEVSHTISFQYTDFDLEDRCTDDHVSIYDGSEMNEDKLLLKTCGSQTFGPDSGNQTARPGFTKPLKSSANEMLIVMETDSSVTAKGFAAKFETSCGSKINTSSSGILEIGHNLRWLANGCEWTITANDPIQHVSLSIMHMDNEPILPSSQCLRKIYVYDGTSTSSPKITEICSSKHPPPITSEGNSLTLSISDVSAQDSTSKFDLKAAYTVLDTECGGDFGSIDGQIASPGYPKPYKNNIECEWTIQASPGNEMEINIDMLDINQTDYCNGDYLEVREGNSVGKMIGVYCGTNSSILPTLPRVTTYWLKFRSDNDGVGSGFRLEYGYAKFVEQTGQSGVITSMMYPSYVYRTLGSYKWRIIVALDNLIRVTIENCILNGVSQISIYDGNDEASDILETIKSDDIPTEPILSSTNVIFVEFEIPTFSASKFMLVWNEVSESEAYESNKETNSLNCSRNSVIRASEADILKIQSPGFPGGYDDNTICQWTFLPRMGYHVSISFTTIDLESSNDCIADYVRVGSGSDMQQFQQSSRMCTMDENAPIHRFHGTPNLRVQFQTDVSDTRTGFEGIVVLDCGGLLESPQGQITNRMIVSNQSQFRMNETCTWTVSVDHGRTIQFDFKTLNLVKNDDGSCNSYIIIRNGIHDDSPFLGLGQYCGDSPVIPETSSNKAIVQFVRNRTFRTLNEFVLTYEQVEYDCGGSFTLDHNTNSTIISTPNYPNIPSAHIECVWRVTAPNGELMKIEFLQRFDLTSTANCTSEYVEVRESSTASSPVIGKYCSVKPLPIFSSSNMVRLMYFTDVLVPKNGFKAKVSFARCGKSIMANSGFISSPGFPGRGAYPTQTTCDYHITGRTGTELNITFLSLDLPEADNCSDVDHIEIYSMLRNADGISSKAEVTKVCGNTIPDSILTFNAMALIRFVSKSGNNLYTGFRFMFQSTRDVCGASIEASTGIIQSPSYPFNLDTIRNCVWKITVPKGHRVKVEVLDVNPIVSGTDELFHVNFFNDFGFTSYIKTFFGNNRMAQPAIVYSTDNKLAIYSLASRGFKMRFTSDEPTVCEGNLNGNEGTFHFPENVTRFYCEFTWDSQRPFLEPQPNNGTLSIKILDESLRPQCIPKLSTGISVIFFANENRTIFTKCPPKYDNIASPYSSTKLTLRNIPQMIFTTTFKYRFQYKVHNCGGILTETMTKISNPTTLALNYGELDCAWQYNTNTVHNIRMILNAPAMNCDTEYINIYWGKTSNGPRVSQICGDTVSNQTINISGQSAYVEYHTEAYNPFESFDIDIVSSDGICGGTLVASNYVFSSPKIGTKYPPNAECEWIIRAQNGYHVGLTFINRFMIETSTNCTKDYVKVFNKVNGEFKEIKRLCGRETPQFLNSTGREMKVLFRTDGDGDGDGFTAQWSENCGGIFKATNVPQLITSPRYPDLYPKNAFCNYSIIADDEQSVTVKFLKLDLEYQGITCFFDNITIYKKQSSYEDAMEKVGTYCTKNSLITFRYTSQIDLVFRTDSEYEESGFKFEFSTDRCGGNITTSKRIESITDDNYYETYLPVASCVWYITAPSDKNIVIRFEQFDLEDHGSCSYDYVTVYEGHGTVENNLKARYCGNLTAHAPVVVVDSNKAIVKFVSDESDHRKGFTVLILFTKNCSQHIHLTHDQPKYTLNKLTDQYESMLTCEYFINAPKGYVIKAKFNQMHLVPCVTIAVNNSCTCDYLNVRDGYGQYSEPFGSFCGHSNPPDILSSTPSLYMRFVTDNIGSGSGFSIDLDMVETPCGPSTYHLNDSLSSITIQSPMNRHLYMPNMNCIWHISADVDKLIKVHFEQFELEADDQDKCTNDFLEITDDKEDGTYQYVREGVGQNVLFSGSTKSKKQYFYRGRQWPNAAHRYCGNNIPIDYFSSYRTISVSFKSNEKDEASGFRFTAKIVSECAQNYTQPQGRIFGKDLSDCESYISVPENYTITLYFTSLSFLLNRECTVDNTPLKIYNGRNNELLESYCADSIPDPLFTATNLLKLKFKNISHAHVSSEEYDITYLVTDKGRGCGGALYNYGGTFTSPGYPNTYRNNSLDCTWIISVPMNLLVAVRFPVFDMGLRATCDSNYVELIENDDTVPPTKFCGTDEPAPYRAKSSRLEVHFKNSINFAGTGWVIDFMAVHEDSILNNF
ncbi:cubilin homolog [Sitodiplosis mosellana]|uniref:cubilin homolog n=1 Tax=Sitodiplosis mosellana TaxID=263140 RepID=UPI002444F77C|nr:cubilin homolog [Sitodiplosis mosellana]